MTGTTAIDELSVTQPEPYELRLPALEIRQGPTRVIYSDGKRLPSFAAISRLHRDAAARVRGYQRPEILSHIAAIRRYVEADDRPMIPNAIVIAFDERVTFELQPTTPARARS